MGRLDRQIRRGAGVLALMLGLLMFGAPAFAGDDREKGTEGSASASGTRTTATATGKGKGAKDRHDATGDEGSAESSGTADSSANEPAPEGSGTSEPTHGCDQAQAGYTHSYASTCDGSPSMNGSGQGTASGKPCAGCVGAADNKNPKGQFPDGSDANNGYECDGNQGVGKTNPAHTGCQATVNVPPPPPPPGPPGPQVSPGPPLIVDEVLPLPPFEPRPPRLLPPVEARPPQDGFLAAVLPVTGAPTLQLLGVAFSLMGAGSLLRSGKRD